VHCRRDIRVSAGSTRLRRGMLEERTQQFPPVQAVEQPSAGRASANGRVRREPRSELPAAHSKAGSVRRADSRSPWRRVCRRRDHPRWLRSGAAAAVERRAIEPTRATTLFEPRAHRGRPLWDQARFLAGDGRQTTPPRPAEDAQRSPQWPRPATSLRRKQGRQSARPSVAVSRTPELRAHAPDRPGCRSDRSLPGQIVAVTRDNGRRASECRRPPPERRRSQADPLRRSGRRGLLRAADPQGRQTSDRMRAPRAPQRAPRAHLPKLRSAPCDVTGGNGRSPPGGLPIHSRQRGR